MGKKTETVKSQRVLRFLMLLMSGETPDKKTLLEQLGASEKNLYNDCISLNQAFSEMGLRQEVKYDRKRKLYYLENLPESSLTNGEILAVCKILLESRSMRREEMLPLLDKLVEGCVPDQNKRAVKKLIQNEEGHYIEPHHGQYILDSMWEMGRAIQEQRVVEIQYERIKEPKLVTRLIEPVGLMFSEYYFYLTAFLRDVDREASFENPDDLFPTIYRVDRIRSFQVLKERFHIPYKDRFEEGEFRKRIQFMYGGRLERVRFRYTGPSIEAVLDRLPTAQILEQDEDSWVVEAEVFGKGIQMWMNSQGNYVQPITGCGRP